MGRYEIHGYYNYIVSYLLLAAMSTTIQTYATSHCGTHATYTGFLHATKIFTGIILNS